MPKKIKKLEKIQGLTSPAPRGALLKFNYKHFDCLVIPLKPSAETMTALNTAEFSQLCANAHAHKTENSSLKFQPHPDGTTGLIESAFKYHLTQNDSYQSMRLMEVARQLFSHSPQQEEIAKLHREITVTFNQIIVPRHTELALKFHYNFDRVSSGLPALPLIANEQSKPRKMSKLRDNIGMAFSLIGPLGYILAETPSAQDIPTIHAPEYSPEYPEEVAAAQHTLIQRFGGLALPSPAIILFRQNSTGPVLLGPVRNQAQRSVGGYGTARCL